MASPQTIQPSNIDTRLSGAQPTTNFGTDDLVVVEIAAALVGRGIFKFDFSSVVPTGSTINSAIFSVYNVTTNGDRTLTCYRLRRTDWVETEATYNIYKTGSNWGTAGAKNTSTDIDTTNSATATATSGWVAFTVTAQVQTALDSVSGVAHFLLADEGSYPGSFKSQQFASRSYATTSVRPKLYIAYTEPAVAPTVTTQAVSSITKNTATGNGTVTADGGATVTERGVCWKTSTGPTTSDSKANSGTGTGAYTVSMTSLTPNTLYYARAYAINSVGTSYGSEVTFTTLQTTNSAFLMNFLQ